MHHDIKFLDWPNQFTNPEYSFLFDDRKLLLAESVKAYSSKIGHCTERLFNLAQIKPNFDPTHHAETLFCEISNAMKWLRNAQSAYENNVLKVRTLGLNGGRC